MCACGDCRTAPLPESREMMRVPSRSSCLSHRCMARITLLVGAHLPSHAGGSPPPPESGDMTRVPPPPPRLSHRCTARIPLRGGPPLPPHAGAPPPPPADGG